MPLLRHAVPPERHAQRAGALNRPGIHAAHCSIPFFKKTIQGMSFSTPESAEASFYAAFEARDLEAMMAVWDPSDNIACIHPMAAPLNGRGPVTAGWQSIFEAAEQFQIQVEIAHQIHDATQVIHVVREYLVIGQDTEPRQPILATNIYRKTDDGWHLVLHHASPLQVGVPPPVRTAEHVLH